MAEGGDEKDDNPFSFKKFVSPKDRDRDKSDDDDNSMSNGPVLDILPDIGDTSSNKSRRKDRAKLVITDHENGKN